MSETISFVNGTSGPIPVTPTNPLPVTATITSEAAAEATASAPAYTEGQDAPLSQNLTGDLRTIAKQSTSPWVVAGGGTAGSAATGVVTVQGIASGTAVPVSDAGGSLTVDYATTGSGTSTGALRVEIASNGTGVVGVTNWPTTVSTGTGAQGASSPRVTVATDTATIAGSAPGTAGSASANVISVQGVASMTPLQVSQGASTTGGYSYLNIAAGQATTVVKASAGTLHSIVLNSAATAANTTTIYDHASGVGTVIGRPAVTTATVPTTLIYDIAFATGLTIITATQNGGDMTVVYK